MVSPNLFFSLQRFAHRSLWKEGEPVWSALLLLSEYLKKRKTCQIEITIPAGVYLERPELISIGKGTVIEPGVCIQGPCIIGKGCVIRHGAYIRESVICGNHCAIGHSSEIKNSILLDSAHATHFTYVGDSILGNSVNLGAGVKCANLRLDRNDVKVFFEGRKINSGLKKLGAIIGDGVQVGCNCVLNPGTLIGQQSVIFPLLNLSGYVPPRHQVQSVERALQMEPIESKILERIGK